VHAQSKLSVAKGVLEQSEESWALKKGGTPYAGNRAREKSSLIVVDGKRARGESGVFDSNSHTEQLFFYYIFK